MMTIPELRARVAELSRDLKDAEEQLFEMERAASPIKEGDLFRRTSRRGWGRDSKEIEERGRVVSFGRGGRAGITPYLKMIKKDGTDSTRRPRPMYGFENWEKI